MIVIVRRRNRRERGQIQQDMEQMFRSLVSGARNYPTSNLGTWRPAVEVYEVENLLVVRAELAGVREEDLSVSIDDSVLRISGTRQVPGTHSKRVYHQTGIPYGEFDTEVFIPYSVSLDDVEASYEDGYLCVILPKAQATRIVPKSKERPATSQEEKT